MSENKGERPALRRYQWEGLNKQQVGAYTEYFVKMEFTMCGFQVYEPEVDDRGIDFVTRFDRGPFLEIQVKSLRPRSGRSSSGYVFMQKDKFLLDEHTYLALGLLSDGQLPKLFLIPSTVWSAPNAGFVDRNYEGLKSSPEWGLTIAEKHMPSLELYAFENTVESLVRAAAG